MALFDSKGLKYAWKAKYLSGHSSYPKSMNVHIIMMPNYLEIPEFPLQIPYEMIHDVQSLSQEKITSLGLLHGGLASVLKRKKVYMVLTFDDDTAIEQNLVFDVEKIDEIQPILYHKIMKHK